MTMQKVMQRKKAPAQAITLRQLPSRLAAELVRQSRTRRLSLNRLVIELLSEHLGLVHGHASSERAPDEVDALAGRWSAEDADAFDRATAAGRQIDDELWTS
jgi:hypothetical protein